MAQMISGDACFHEEIAGRIRAKEIGRFIALFDVKRIVTYQASRLSAPPRTSMKYLFIKRPI